MVIACFYWFAIWSTIKSISRTLERRYRLSKTIPFLLAMVAFFVTTIWCIIAIIYGDGYSDNPVEPLPPIALLSSFFATGVWLLAAAAIYAYDWVLIIWTKVKAG